jgi:hypothetical protein
MAMKILVPVIEIALDEFLQRNNSRGVVDTAEERHGIGRSGCVTAGFV